jgi:hypothetical protein
MNKNQPESLRLLLAAFLLVFVSGVRAADTPEVKSLPKGTSTWVYGYSDGIAKQVGKFNTTALPNLGFKYFFPYAGSVGFTDIQGLSEVFKPGRKQPRPAAAAKLSSFEAPRDWADQYYSRISGYLHPPKDGEYTFWLASDDDGELYLSADDKPAGRKLIASVKGWADPGQWDKLGSQKSATVNLKAGGSYWIEAVHREGSGADHLEVAWAGPGLDRAVIGGEYLSPADNPAARGSILRECWFATAFQDSGEKKYSSSYSRENTAAYARTLPPGILQLSIVDGRNDNGAFDRFTEDEYRQMAEEVARPVLEDSAAAGIHIDIEPFRAAHMPFYRHLRRILNAKGKLTSMFVGFVNDATMTQIFESCDIVVLSGYDIGCEHSLSCYMSTLEQGVARAQKIAVATGGHYLVGIPASTSWGEYEYTAGNGCSRRSTGVSQEAYVRAATGVICAHKDDPQCLGASLWSMSDPGKDKEDPDNDKCSEGSWRYVDGCCKQPTVIRETVWNLLAEYCR